MTRKSPTATIAIIIPAYNESGVLPLCLDAIARQTDMPDQVIVVDNNSTDDTAAIARSYSFVTVVNETKQGISHARNKGFDSAATTILGRIDADTIVPADWVATVRRSYVDNIKVSSNHGVAGTARFAMPRAQMIGNLAGKVVMDWSYFPISRLMLRDHTLYGCNMAITRTAWEMVRDDICTDDKNIHEEVDLTVHMLQHGATIEYGTLPAVQVSTRGLIEKPSKFIWRLRVWPTAIRRHQRLFRKTPVNK